MQIPTSQEFLQELEAVELRLLQEIWALESSLLEIIRRVQDLQLQMSRLQTSSARPPLQVGSK